MKTLTLITSDSMTIAFFRAIAPALRCDLRVVGDWSALSYPSSHAQTCKLVILDLQTVAAAALAPRAAVTTLRKSAPQAKIILTAPRATLIDTHDSEWASALGADAILPQLRALRWKTICDPILAALNDNETSAKSDAQRLAPFIRAAQQAERSEDALSLVNSVENAGVDLAALALRMGRSGGVDIRDRTYHLRSYEAVFVSSEALQWIASAHRCTSTAALAIGKALQACGLIYHVAREQLFADENFFFRVSKIPTRHTIDDVTAQVSASTGFVRRDRTYLGTSYPNCFVGSEALDWFLSRGYSVNEAMSMGQRLIDLSIISHVTNDHPFKAGNFFYHFSAR